MQRSEGCEQGSVFKMSFRRIAITSLETEGKGLAKAVAAVKVVVMAVVAMEVA